MIGQEAKIAFEGQQRKELTVLAKPEAVVYVFGTAMLLIGIVMLIVTAIIMTSLSVAGIYVETSWWTVLLLSFILMITGMVVSWYYRQVIYKLTGQEKSYPYPHFYPPIQPQTQRMCVGCGRPIPFDANFCPYCRHQYKE